MARTLLSIYPKNSGRYDEMLDEDGMVRPHWQPFFAHLDQAAPELMRQRLDFVNRSIQENGVTYNVYADPKGADRPWQLDPLPLIIPAAEWEGIASAVAQRATVLNAILADLYGPQSLLAEGLLPQALAYGHGGYLWPCRGVQPPGGTHLHFYAVDLARSPDGGWWVIADRTQAPSGAGYSLENRLIVSRVFPELFRDLKVQHLASFFRCLQDSLAGWAPYDLGESPLIVLLTPGPYNETYFEHAYLARYLGFPLVEGQDLTVRGDTVYMKTLTGLKRVHAILRRQDDDFCDPLELRGDSALGVPGLLQAVRAGRVLVANALGSGVIESPALPGFLPAICERLLGEPLRLPSIATWWCGEAPAREYTLKNLERLVLKPAYPQRTFAAIFGSDLRARELERVRQQVRLRPHDYVAQELVKLSQAPTWSRNHERRLLARAVGLRVYAVATPQGYVVMPGGLARVAGDPNARVISMQRGGSSKDAWVLTDGQVSTFSLLKPSIGVADLVRAGRSLSSRVVENLFWLGRYAERCDGNARLLRVALSRFIEAGGGESRPLASLMAVAVAIGLVPRGENQEDGSRRPLNERLTVAVLDEAWAPGLAANLRRLQWSAMQIRERLSTDHWHAIIRLLHELKQVGVNGAASQHELGEVIGFLDRALLSFASLAGFAMDNMTCDAGWRLHVLGRRLERLDHLATLCAHFLSQEITQEGLEWLLEAADSSITYRSRYVARPELLPVLDLVVLDDSNPHAVFFQLQLVERYLDALTAELGGERDATLTPYLERLSSIELGTFTGATCERCRNHDHCTPCHGLAATLFGLAAAAREVSDRLGMRYFAHVGDVSRQTLAN